MTDWEAMRSQLMEEELEMLRLQRLQFSCKPMATQSCFRYSMDGLKIPQGS